MVDDYNDTFHTTIKDTPNNVFESYEDIDYMKKVKSVSLKPKFRLAREKEKSIPAKLRKQLEIGDLVRTVKRKATLDKYGTDNWSTGVFTVNKIISDTNNLRTTRYKTTEIKDRKHYQYAREELQKVDPDTDEIPTY